MQYAACVIGNSSSGILEAPSFHIPVINIGNRQKGRMQAEMTINCPADKECILKALNNLPSKEKLKNIKNPYEGKNPSELIEKEIFEYLSKPHQYKIFYDMPF